MFCCQKENILVILLESLENILLKLCVLLIRLETLSIKVLDFNRAVFSPKNVNFHFDNIDFDKFSSVKSWKQ